MKKMIFLGALLLALSINAQNKNFGIGINGGLPIGNLEETFSTAFGLDVNYLYHFRDEISVGVATGLVFFSGKEKNGVKPENKMYIPIAASFRFDSITDKFFLSGDVGYAIGVSPSGDRGGVYFKPMLGYKITESLDLNMFYTGIKKKQPTYSYVGLGLMFRI